MATFSPVVRMAKHTTGWRAVTWFLRALPFLIAALHGTGLVDFDSWTAMLWQGMTSYACCHWAMAEAIVAAGSFFTWIVGFQALDSLQFTKQFRFIQRPAAPAMEFFRQTAQAMKGEKEDGVAWLVRVWASPAVYLGVIAAIHAVKPPKPMEMEAPTFARLVAEIALGIWAYDFVFYWIHVLMHTFPRLPHGHNVHHELKETHVGEKRISFLEAESVVHHSLQDGAMQVFVNIMVQNLPLYGLPKHKLSRFIHNALVTYLLVETHAGMDLPWGIHRICPALFGGAYRHEIHHQTHRTCFHQFFRYLDDILGYGPPQPVAARAAKVSSD